MFVRTELTTDNAGDWLERLSVCAPEDIISVELLGWGISNTLVNVLNLPMKNKTISNNNHQQCNNTFAHQSLKNERLR